jgi:DNA-binding response OmpR family regulator
MSAQSARLPEDTGYILVIEDDVSIQQLYQWALAEEGWQSVGASNGVAGLEQAREREPSLVILDMNLPGLHGEAVADELHRLYDGIPILVVTSNIHAEENARKARAFGYLRKPFDLNALLVSVSFGLEQGRAIEHRAFPDLA